MPEMKVGDVIGVKCQVQPGPFSDELVITVETTTGPISGFVRRDHLRETKDGWLVRAVVLEMRPNEIQVDIEGSFFTTNGVASVSQHMAMAA